MIHIFYNVIIFTIKKKSVWPSQDLRLRDVLFPHLHHGCHGPADRERIDLKSLIGLELLQQPPGLF